MRAIWVGLSCLLILAAAGCQGGMPRDDMTVIGYHVMLQAEGGPRFASTAEQDFTTLITNWLDGLKFLTGFGQSHHSYDYYSKPRFHFQPCDTSGWSMYDAPTTGNITVVDGTVTFTTEHYLPSPQDQPPGAEFQSITFTCRFAAVPAEALCTEAALHLVKKLQLPHKSGDTVTADCTLSATQFGEFFTQDFQVELRAVASEDIIAL